MGLFHKVFVSASARLLNPTAIFDDRKLHYRERALNAYSPLGYWITTWVSQLPFMVLCSVMFGCIVYPSAGLRPGFGYFMVFQGFGVLATLVLYFMFSCVAALCPSQFVALHFLPLLQVFLIVLDGFPEYLPNMQDWLKYCTFGMVSRYAYQGMVLNEFQDNHDLPEAHRYVVMLGFTGISIAGCAAMMFLLLILSMWGFYLSLTHVDFERR
jgi:hypothetical protein